MFAEDFSDARGFGWHLNGGTNHDWPTLLGKKARLQAHGLPGKRLLSSTRCSA